jgi:hypothetical protein
MKIDFWNISYRIEPVPFGKSFNKGDGFDGEALDEDVIPTLSKVIERRKNNAQKKQLKTKTNKPGKSKKKPVIWLILLVFIASIWMNIDKLKTYYFSKINSSSQNINVIDSLILADSLSKVIGNEVLDDDVFNQLMPVSDSLDKLSEKVLDTTENAIQKDENILLEPEKIYDSRLSYNQFSFMSKILCNTVDAQSIDLNYLQNKLDISLQNYKNSTAIEKILAATFERQPHLNITGNNLDIAGDAKFKLHQISNNNQLFTLIDVLDAFILPYENMLMSIDMPIPQPGSNQIITLDFNGAQMEMCSMFYDWSLINAELTVKSIKARGHKNDLKTTLVFEFME